MIAGDDNDEDEEEELAKPKTSAKNKGHHKKSNIFKVKSKGKKEPVWKSDVIMKTDGKKYYRLVIVLKTTAFISLK